MRLLSHIKININAGAEVSGAEAMMVRRDRKREAGFSVLEIAVVVVLVGVVIAFAAPKISNGMREYRLGVGTRQMVDYIKRAKSQAVANNQTSSLIADPPNRRIGLVVRNSAGTVLRTDYYALPRDVSFALPPNVVAPMTGAPTSTSVSFPLQSGSSTVRQQDFNTRGFPAVTGTTMNAVYLTNGTSYRAVTLNSYGGIRTWWWVGGQWRDSTQ